MGGPGAAGPPCSAAMQRRRSCPPHAPAPCGCRVASCRNNSFGGEADLAHAKDINKEVGPGRAPAALQQGRGVLGQRWGGTPNMIGIGCRQPRYAAAALPHAAGEGWRGAPAEQAGCHSVP